ncbi:MAG: transglycosylase SLT domain-containing protein [Saprospiraceae bacterium]|jgi:membrane-bound lytic murein transglycosylase D|nr:transglycosylase SLT domain-containing protein [Saprospiraceae bacterium]
MSSRVLILVSGILFSLQLCANHLPSNYNDPIHHEFDTESIKSRVLAMDCVVPPKYTTSVEGYLRGYLQRNRGKSERILGRLIKYFPIFDKYLEEHGMPADLKYLSVVESALVPTAISRVGAGGLWQFMPATGNEYDLKITRYVDDRFDPQKSTDAAMKHLAKQYKRFGKWELALAAYNSGAGRVNRAIRYSKSKNFWRLQRYLPKETRNYVPAFIAAKYLINYYKEHDIQPETPDFDVQLTETMKVYSYLAFTKIESITGLSRNTIKELNPAYKRGFIPTNSKGYDLVLPRRVISAMKDYLVSKRPDQPSENFPTEDEHLEYLTNTMKAPYTHALYSVTERDDIFKVAELFKCSPYHLMIWNQLPTSEITKGQELIIWYPQEIIRYRPFSGKRIETLPSIPLNTYSKEPHQKENAYREAIPSAVSYKYHRLRRYESLVDVVKKYPKSSLKEIMEMNGFSKKNKPVAGAIIKVLKL